MIIIMLPWSKNCELNRGDDDYFAVSLLDIQPVPGTSDMRVSTEGNLVTWRWSAKKSALIELSPLFSQSNLELVSSPASSKPCCVRVSCTLSAWKIWFVDDIMCWNWMKGCVWECCECYQHHDDDDDECVTIGWKSVFHTKAMLISSPSRWHSWWSRSWYL